MNHGLSRQCIFVAALLYGAALPTHAIAAQERPLLRAALRRAPGRELRALRVTYAGGEASRPHRHAGDAFVYVLSGRIRSQLEGGPVRVYGVGESWFEPAGIRHLVSANASADAPASMLVVFVDQPVGERASQEAQPVMPARTQSR